MLARNRNISGRRWIWRPAKFPPYDNIRPGEAQIEKLPSTPPNLSWLRFCDRLIHLYAPPCCSPVTRMRLCVVCRSFGWSRTRRFKGFKIFRSDAILHSLYIWLIHSERFWHCTQDKCVMLAKFQVLPQIQSNSGKNLHKGYLQNTGRCKLKTRQQDHCRRVRFPLVGVPSYWRKRYFLQFPSYNLSIARLLD